MGVGLGLWARPAMSERQLAAPAAKLAPAPIRLLQIVVDDGPAPLGAPIEVLPAIAPSPRPLAPSPPSTETFAPARPGTGLLRVQAVEPDTAEPEPKAAPAPTRPAVIKTKAAPPPAKPKPAIKAKVGKAEAAATSSPRLQKVRAVEQPAPTKAKLLRVDLKRTKAKALPAKVERPAKARLDTPRAHKPAQLRRIAHAASRPTLRKAEPVARVQKVKAVRRPVSVAKPLRTAKLVKPAKPQVQKAAAKVRLQKAAPMRPLKPARGAGPVRVAKAAPRPEAAIRNADKQMYRAYSTARTAGVPDWQLRRQQQRWEQARASAAREAPWAVRDVYLARIAELHDLTRDAAAPGN
jgi:hypothetical protein